MTPQAGGEPAASQAASPPSISLPKGGGAIRGIGEKFAASPATGTGSMSVPIASSPGRSGFHPELFLSYDSGAGNGPFGFGWTLAVAAITRRTDKGLPRYEDAADSDVFVLSGSEDLVPVYRQDLDGSWVAAHPGYQRDADGAWVRDPDGRLVVHEDELDGHRVRPYRPRAEGAFYRIERWTSIASQGDVHWRSISKENVLAVYGLDAQSRIADPLDASRIFSWLLCETRDDKGNAVLYRYRAEDGVGLDLSRAHESNRGARDDRRRRANRYLKRVHYGNRDPLLDGGGRRPRFLDQAQVDAQIAAGRWMFELVLDYGDHDRESPAPNDDRARDTEGLERYPWSVRPDVFSSYRAGFEVRTARLCRRILMFHHFAGEDGVGRDCLVRSTDFTYSADTDPADVRNPVYAFLNAVKQTGYRRLDTGYEWRNFPPVEFDYTEAKVQDVVEEVDPTSLENLPVGLGGDYRWVDLHGQGIPGILTQQGGAWFYKRNLSPIPITLPDGSEQIRARFAPLETVPLAPNVGFDEGADIIDLAGDGSPDVVMMDVPTPGFFEHDEPEGWKPFRPFVSRLDRSWRDPNLRLVDLDGDGRADVLITEDDAFVWHQSLGEEGYRAARRVAQAVDEEKGPRLVFADASQSVHLADFSGDGMSDIVRVRNGEACYWPNLGHGRFGPKVAMDNAPWFDDPDQFDPGRILLADVDGSGTTDVIYLHAEGVRLFFNQSGNGWSAAVPLKVFPSVDEVSSITVADLLGNGTACLVWSSPLSTHAGRAMRYVNLMGDRKPHLLVRTVNNLGAETHVDYAPSTRFYLQDERDGRPWPARLPFPVHVVERVATYDHISRNRFVTRYAYHHGYFDGDDREFRGFGMVEQWDSEELGALASGALASGAANLSAASHVPPAHTKTWFHTGLHTGRDHVSDHYAREYFREPGASDAEARDLLLPDTKLPAGLTLEEEREACRALKGSMLRQEVYADDAGSGGTAAETARHLLPYSVTEQNFGVRRLQPEGSNRHAVFLTHTSEVITYHYERVPNDPRIEHALTLEVDAYANVLKRAIVAYGRRAQVRVVDGNDEVQQVPNPSLGAFLPSDRTKQTTPLLVYTEYRFTNSIDTPHAARTPMECENVTFELTGYLASGPAGRYRAEDLVEPDAAAPSGAPRVRLRFTDEVAYEATATSTRCRRPVERLRTLYRRDDLTALLPLGVLHELALPGEGYRLAFTPGLLAQVYQRPTPDGPSEALLADPASVLAGTGGAQGGYVRSQALKADGRFPAADPDDHWWMPSGRSFFSDDPSANAAGELNEARGHFFLNRRYRDQFDKDTLVDFDGNDLLIVETRDALGNHMTVGASDYRVLQPRLLVDPNRNRTEVAFDALGRVEAMAVMGKQTPAPQEGDTLAGFSPALSDAQLQRLFDGSDPSADAAALLQGATTRFVYDLDCFQRTRRAAPNDPAQWRPACAASVTRETHMAAAPPPHGLRFHLSFSYSDGFGREVQTKLQAEPGPLAPGVNAVPRRWIANGWTIFNNKGKPVRRYEPFFSQTQRFEYGVAAGVSPVLFYDPVGRVVVTLHPNDTYEKVVFDAWGQTTYDVNDTCAARGAQTGDPRTDPDIRGIVARFFAAQPAATPWKTWHQQRADGSLGAHERAAALRAAAHADTPTTAHQDVLGRPFLSVSRNRVVCPGHDLDGTEDAISTRTDLDIEGNQRAVRDAVQQAEDPLGRVVMRYAYDMLGNRIYQLSMEAGARWILRDTQGRTIRNWDDRGHKFVTSYDAMRRPVSQIVRGTIASGERASDPRTLGRDVMVSRTEYGEPPAGANAADEDRARRLNLRTRIFRQFDAAGVATNARLNASGDAVEAYDFKGNLLCSTRQFASDYKAIPDWLLNPPLASESFFTSARYDAMNRVVQTVLPHSSLARAKRHVVQPAYDEGGLLERIDVWLERGAEPAQVLDPTADAPSPVGVADVDYDAKGQRLLVRYKNGTTTRYAYDSETFRLVRLYTTRGAAFTEDCNNPQPPPATTAAPEEPSDRSSCGVQNLRYMYDPAGNITHIQDDAREAIYFRNQRVEPSNDYTYDALYRLIEATGREHLGQQGDGSRNPPTAPDGTGTFHVRHDHPNTLQAMGSYVERYVYDLAGNILQLQHRGSDPVHPGWTRAYTYVETSLIEDGSGGALAKSSNRLTLTTNPNASASPADAYQHDRHGNMVRMPHLGGAAPGPNLHWDSADRLRRVDLGGGGTAYYVFDATGARVRKVWEKAPGLTEERIYAGEFELFRRHPGPAGAGNVTLERETLHVMDDEQRVALVELRTIDAAGTDPAPPTLIRYQMGNHLSSVSLELDHRAHIVSYEEYAPYGSSTYQAVRSQTETPKRYRFTSKERDEETGFSHHGARFYASWLGRWCSADPAGLIGGPNLYRYARANPVGLVDPDGRQPAPVVDPETIAIAGTALMRAAQAWGTASVITGGGGAALATGGPAAGGAALATGAVASTASMPAVAAGALAAGQVALAVGMALLTNLWMQRSASIARYGNPYGMSSRDIAFPVLREVQRLRTDPFPIPEPAPEPAPEEEQRRRRPRPGRVYVTYTKYNSRTGRYYSGRTSAVIDLNLPWRPQAEAAVRARDANHHVDEEQEPTDTGFGPAVLDQFAVGYAVDYNQRYRDVGYLAIRGREQQGIDFHGRRRHQELGLTTPFSGGAQADTNPGTPLTENTIRGVAKDNPLGEVFHNAANLVFRQELAPFTGNRIRPPARVP